ncbi:hypothetical protein F4801DRAFT_429977 [Xylaria longipes]|nr:hypothetical protein F4801DRAFT_429977 [Xylaria longipes]
MSYSESETFEITSDCDSNDPGILTAKRVRLVDLEVSEFGYLLAKPNVEELEFSSCYWDNAKLPKSENTSVRAIRLVDTTMDEMGFNKILCKIPHLKSLVYFRPADECDTGFDMMGGELAKHGQNLEHLELWNDALMPFYSPFGSLHTLTKLKTLEMDLELLIGFRDNPRNWDDYMDGGFVSEEEEEPDYEEINSDAGDWSLVKLLPPSLEKLTLEIDTPKLSVYFNTYERWEAKFEELLTADQFDKLHWVRAANLDAVAKKLCGRPGNRWALIGWGGDTMARTPLRTEAETDASGSSVTDTKTDASGSSVTDTKTDASGSSVTGTESVAEGSS